MDQFLFTFVIQIHSSAYHSVKEGKREIEDSVLQCINDEFPEEGGCQ